MWSGKSDLIAVLVKKITHFCQQDGKTGSLGNCMSEIDIEMLVAYLNDELTAVERAAVDTFLQENPNGQAKLAEAKQLLDGLRSDEIVAPSASLLSRAQAAFRQQVGRLAERLQHEADLQFDSWAQPAPSGARGLPQERQLLFHEGAYDLDLQLVNDRAADAVTMRGQLLSASKSPHELEGVALSLHHAKSGIERRGITDGYGRFSFSHLEKGEYILTVAMQSYDIVIPIGPLTVAG